MSPKATAIHRETNPRTAKNANEPLTIIDSETFCLTTDMVFLLNL